MRSDQKQKTKKVRRNGRFFFRSRIDDRENRHSRMPMIQLKAMIEKNIDEQPRYICPYLPCGFRAHGQWTRRPIPISSAQYATISADHAKYTFYKV